MAIRIMVSVFLVFFMCAWPQSVVRATELSGPIVLGGDDQNDHGRAVFVDQDSDAGTPDVVATQDGWRYVMLSLERLLSTELRASAQNSIAVIGTDGSDDYVNSLGLTPSDGGLSCTAMDELDTYCMMEVIKSELDRRNGDANAPSVTYYETAADVSNFFEGLNSGAVDAAVIYIPGDQGPNDLGDGTAVDDRVDSTDLVTSAMEQELIDHAPTIDAFNKAGGGILAGGSMHYDFWLTALLPGLHVVRGNLSNVIKLSPAGLDLWSGLTDRDVSSHWHSHFWGDFGGLQVLGKGWFDWTDANLNDMIDAGEATSNDWPGPDGMPGTSDDAQTIVILGGAAGEVEIVPELPSTNAVGTQFNYWLATAALLFATIGLHFLREDRWLGER
jgi:hypothetical protein